MSSHRESRDRHESRKPRHRHGSRDSIDRHESRDSESETENNDLIFAYSDWSRNELIFKLDYKTKWLDKLNRELDKKNN